MIDMVGIGPFITLSLIVGIMQGATSIFAWMLGALLAYMDGFVWAELGSQYPEAGGSYVFLQKLYDGKWGKLMAFLFIWQTTLQAPLVVASGSIGFSQYLSFLIPMTPWQQKMVSGALVVFLVFLLFRGIRSVGKISVVFGVITIGTILWVIIAGFSKANFSQAFDFHSNIDFMNIALFASLGQASLKAVYSYLGYYNVCHLGGEIMEPQKNIPRSIFISITAIALLYLAMQTMVMAVLPWQEVASSSFVISTYFEKLHNHFVGQIATVCILCIAVASLFSVMLGYSRVPYAAALNGDFFKIFAKTHPKYHFPHISLLVLGGLAFIFSLLFKMKDVITAIVVMRILIQFVAQAVGVILSRKKRAAQKNTLFKMPLFPLPAIISIVIWLFIFFSSDYKFILFAVTIIVTGILLFYLKEKITRKISVL